MIIHRNNKNIILAKCIMLNRILLCLFVFVDIFDNAKLLRQSTLHAKKMHDFTVVQERNKVKGIVHFEIIF